MNKMLRAFLCVLITITLLAGCSGTENNYENMPTIHPSMAPTYFSSLDEFHNYLLSARAYVNDRATSMSMGDGEKAEMQTAVNTWDLGEMEHYYIPSWLPEGFTLNHISVTNWSVGYTYTMPDYDYDRDLESEYVLNNIVVFEWIRADGYIYTEESMKNELERVYYGPIHQIGSLYYHDYGTIENPDINLVRSFNWVQKGHWFRLDVPLWAIAETPSGIGEIAANALVLNSALEVELEDGVSYEPPASIALDQPTADISAGDTLTLTADVSPDNATINAVMWSSSDNSVATVSQSGVVTRVGEGSATITARTVANGLTATCEVTG